MSPTFFLPFSPFLPQFRRRKGCLSEISCVAIRNADSVVAKFRVGAKLGKFTRTESENFASGIIWIKRRGEATPEIVLRFASRSDRYPMERRIERTGLIIHAARTLRGRNFYNSGEIARDQHSKHTNKRGGDLAPRSGKLRPPENGIILSECIARL